MTALSGLAHHGSASLSQCERLVEAMEAEKLPAALAPFLALADAPVGARPPSRRAEDVLSACRLLGESNVASSPLGTRIPALLKSLRTDAPMRHEELMRDDEWRRLLMACVADGDDDRLRVAAEATVACHCWDDASKAVLDRAFHAERLPPQGVVFLTQCRFERDDDFSGTLAGLRWLAERGVEIDFVAQMLNAVSRRGQLNPNDLDWVDFELLRGHLGDSVEKALRQAVQTVENMALGGEDDRFPQVRIPNALHVVHDVLDGRAAGFTKPRVNTEIRLLGGYVAHGEALCRELDIRHAPETDLVPGLACYRHLSPAPTRRSHLYYVGSGSGVACPEHCRQR